MKAGILTVYQTSTKPIRKRQLEKKNEVAI